GGERLVGRHHQGRPLQPLHQPRGGRALPGAGRAEQDDVPVAPPRPTLKLVDGRRLVAGRLVVADHLEAIVEAGDVQGHAGNPTSTLRHFSQGRHSMCTIGSRYAIVWPRSPAIPSMRGPLAAAARGADRTSTPDWS